MSRKYDINIKRYGDEAFAMTSENIRLSVLKPSAYKKVSEYIIRNRKFHKPYAQTHDESYFSPAVQKELLKYELKGYKAGTIVPLWISSVDSPWKVIGKVTFFNIAMGGMMNCAIGYHLDYSETGKGIMTGAVEAALQMMFDYLKLHRVEAFILPENEKSLNVVKRVGFTEEGLRRSYMHINGHYRDHVAFYILEDKFR